MATSKFGDGQMVQVLIEADVPVATAVRRGVLRSFLAGDDIPSPSREGALGTLDNKRDFSRSCSHPGKLEAEVSLRADAPELYVSNVASFEVALNPGACTSPLRIAAQVSLEKLHAG